MKKEPQIQPGTEIRPKKELNRQFRELHTRKLLKTSEASTPAHALNS